MKDQAGKVHKYDFGTDYTSGYPYKYVVLGHSVIPDEVEWIKPPLCIRILIARIYFTL